MKALEVRQTEDVFEVLALLKEGWLLNRVASHQNIFIFLMIRV
jgi:hypothetical protein